MKRVTITSTLFYLASIFFHPAQADSTAQFHGTLMQASCVFDAADVDLGDIDIEETSDFAIRNFTLNMTCKGSPANPVEVQAFGDEAECSLMERCFATTIDGLAIFLLMQDENEFDSYYHHLYPNGKSNDGKDDITKITAKNVINAKVYIFADKNKITTGGDFSSSITLRVTMA